jgi:RNA-directed DNA polymerase
VNTGASWPTLATAKARVLEIQTKLHRWAGDDPDRRFDDLFNLVCDPAFLLVAWHRVRTNRGARSAGVDGQTAYYVETQRGTERFLNDLRGRLKDRTFAPLPVRERMIPKPGTRKRRRLGIPTISDRVVQGSLKLVLEPIFEADFQPCSYGFRPARRAHDAMREIHLLATSSYEWVVEGDIEKCFDTIDHVALMQRVRRRVGDNRVLALVKSFLHAGILTELGDREATTAGTPQGGLLSPLLANIALSVLDDQFAHDRQTLMEPKWRRQNRRNKGLANYKLVRYADDFVVMVHGTSHDAEQLRDRIADILSPMGMRLSPEKTAITHIDEGFDFLGFRIQRRHKRGTVDKRYVYTYPSAKSVKAVKAKVRAILRRSNPAPPDAVLLHLNAVLRGWANYHRHGVASKTFGAIDAYVWWRFARWLRVRHKGLTWNGLRRRFMVGWDFTIKGKTLIRAASIPIVRYRYRGANIPTPWTPITQPA